MNTAAVMQPTGHLLWGGLLVCPGHLAQPHCRGHTEGMQEWKTPSCYGGITTGRKNCGSKVIGPSVAIVWGKNDG